MSSSSKGFSHRHREGMLSAITIGFLLILVGTIFILNPGLPRAIIDFARPESFRLDSVATSLNVSLPIPKDPYAHHLIFETVGQFCLVWAVFLVAMLAVRFIFHSPTRNKAEALGNIVFWFGAAYFVQTLLVGPSASTWARDAAELWFGFWAAIITLIGVSLIVRAVFLIVAWKTRKD